MTNRLLVDLEPDGWVSVSIWPDNGELPSPVGKPFEVVWPLDGDALEDLRWYLEDYLRAPFGVYGERGPQVAGRLTAWGHAVFTALFGSGPARDAYVRVRTRSDVGAEMVFRSSSPRWLGLPWELVCDPDRPTPVALDHVGVSRSLPTTGLTEAFTVGGEQLRVLMVISRPKGTADVGYRMVARPLLERLAVVRGNIELEVLRPPTLENLAEVLSNAQVAGKPFQVVHFDGHGVLASRRAAGSGAPLTFTDPAAQGLLVFERPGGGPHEVPAADVAQVMAQARVPVVVLNACQSGAVGKRLEAAVATRLLQEGTASVVAMAYSVYAVAAAEFMAAFYERLFAGDRVSDAVSAGRRRLARRNERPSPKGKMPLADWVVPVHYVRREVRFPDLLLQRADELSLDARLDRLDNRQIDEPSAALAAVDTFVGRDGLFFTLEVAARLQRVIVLYGSAGIGKTELAKAFGRWWRDTGGVERPEWVIWQSFKPGVASFGLDGTVTDIGLRVFGSEFARLDTVERRDAVLQLLTQRRLMLIWDNFETVYSMPDPTGGTPPLDATSRDELKLFLERIAAGGASAIVITSRTDEAWLGDLRRIPVGGLAPDEAIEYADLVLAPYPDAAPRRAKRTFAHLMEWLDGHPLSMRAVLPYLDTTEPAQLLAGLQGTAALPGRDTLAASINYSFQHLSMGARRLLVALSLLHGVADVHILTTFSDMHNVPQRFHGYTVDDWKQAMDEAVRVGLLSRFSNTVYTIHPALPAYLVDQWRLEESNHYDQQRAVAQTALLEAYGRLGDSLLEWLQRSDASVAFTIIEMHRHTLGSQLGYALDRGLWIHALAMVQPLYAYWSARGLEEEIQGWIDRGLLALEGADSTPPALDDPAGGLWLFLVFCQANRQLSAYRVREAEETYHKIRNMLEKQPRSGKVLQQIGPVYHQLGIVAQHQERLDDAEDWYRKSLTIADELGDQRQIAIIYHQLGAVAEAQGRLNEAEDWYRKSLMIKNELGDQSRMMTTFIKLGWLAQSRGRLDDAENWYHKSLTIAEELGDLERIASSYHQLGWVAQSRGRLDDAENWYHKSLTITEKLGIQRDMAYSFNQLGSIAMLRRRLDDAEDWYRKSLAIAENLGDQRHIATSYHQLGMVAEVRGRLDDAEDCYRKSLTIKEQLGNRPGMALTYHHLGTVAQQRGRLDDAQEWYLKSLATKEEVGNWPGMVTTLGQMALLAEERGQLEEAMACIIKRIILFAEFPHLADEPAGPLHLRRLTTELGVDTLDRLWHRLTGEPVPQVIRDFIASNGT